MDWIKVAQDRDRWRTLVKVVMNYPQNAVNFLTSWKPVSFSRRTLLHRVSKVSKRSAFTCQSSAEAKVVFLNNTHYVSLVSCKRPGCAARSTSNGELLSAVYVPWKDKYTNFPVGIKMITCDIRGSLPVPSSRNCIFLHELSFPRRRSSVGGVQYSSLSVGCISVSFLPGIRVPWTWLPGM
jgi:hypothetical protein